MIVLQGLEDKVVPPNQAEDMIAALRKKGVPVASIFFEGEQHGFRKAENIMRALDAELYFYSRIFGFDLPGNPEGSRSRTCDVRQPLEYAAHHELQVVALRERRQDRVVEGGAVHGLQRPATARLAHTGLDALEELVLRGSGWSRTPRRADRPAR